MSKQAFIPSEELLKERKTLLHPLTADLEEYKNSLGDGSKTLRGLASGFKRLDTLIGGLDRFTLLTGYSGNGKTTLTLQLALGVAQTAPVIIYSFEMSRTEIITKLIQINAQSLGLTGLHTNTIELQGNDPKLADDLKASLEQSLQGLTRTGERLFIKDSSNGIPRVLPHTGDKTPTLFDDIEQVKKLCKAERVLVVIDSIQDLVRTDNANQVASEIETINALVTLQQKTGASILAIAQKNKGSVNSDNSYSDVMGSMSFIYKPNTVIELMSGSEIRKKTAKGDDVLEGVVDDAENRAEKDGGKARFIHSIKSRFTGEFTLPLTYYGQYAYFVEGDEEYKHGNY